MCSAKDNVMDYTMSGTTKNTMAFIISKKSSRWKKERNLYYLVENYRDGSKVKRKTLLALKEYNSVAGLLVFTEQKRIRLSNQLQKRIERLKDYAKTGKTSSPLPPTIHTGRIMLRFVEETKAEMEQCEVEIEKIKSFL